jgi:hypothetical protein
MDIQDCIELVETLLKKNNKKHIDSHAQMIYERGFLTGLIARIMLTDPILRREIQERIKHKK